MRFANKSVLVTGATRGIGRAAAQAFLAEGARVAINGRTETSVAASLHAFQGAVGASALAMSRPRMAASRR